MENFDEGKHPPYLVETTAHYGDVDAITAYLVQRLSDGWALIAVEGVVFYFKAVSQ
jgi:hypothetical protein